MNHATDSASQMIILCDFDDTAAEQNVATLLMDRFTPLDSFGAELDWQKMHQQFLTRDLTLKEYQEAAFSGLHLNRDQQTEYVRRQAKLRAGFKELAAFCLEHNIHLAINSYGLDFYVEALLIEHGLKHIPFYSAETAISPKGTTFSYRFSREGCEAWGNCKCRVVEGYQAQGHQVIYAGDGISDTCPAAKADFVFARSSLLEFCKNWNVEHQELTDFRDMVTYLQTNQATSTPTERLHFD
ncbi:MAG: MtnX-like HAD-IB family phosphatase [Chloroflexi bacterium]|nr:MtnX-like HAD-IB family phosphatase [Chloroflexota bacterium]